MLMLSCIDDIGSGRARAENSQFMTLASYDKGVQAKEEVNFIREMMMHDAIKELQSEMSTRYESDFCLLSKIRVTFVFFPRSVVQTSKEFSEHMRVHKKSKCSKYFYIVYAISWFWRGGGRGCSDLIILNVNHHLKCSQTSGHCDDHNHTDFKRNGFSDILMWTCESFFLSFFGEISRTQIISLVW